MQLGLGKKKFTPYISYILPIAGVAVAIGLTFFVTIPRFNSISDLQRERTQVEARWEKLQKKSAMLEELLAYKGSLADSFKLLGTALPSEDEVPLFMTQVQQIATDSGVGMSSLKYAGGKKAETGKKAAVETADLGRVRLQAVLEAPYAFLQGFISNLEKASRVINVDSVKFSAQSKEMTIVSATLDLISYYTPIPEEKVIVDAPITLDLGAPEFIGLLNKVKALRVYEVTVTPGGIGKPDPFAR